MSEKYLPLKSCISGIIWRWITNLLSSVWVVIPVEAVEADNKCSNDEDEKEQECHNILKTEKRTWRKTKTNTK